MFIMVDGFDGSGKSTVVHAILENLGQTKTAANLKECTKRGRLPFPEECAGADLILSHEPTYAWIGAAIREELIRNGTNYSMRDIAHAFSLDRLVLYSRLLIPLIKRGVDIIQDRGVSASIAYQSGKEISLEEVMKLPGNALALRNAPDILIITDCKIQTALSRLAGRSGKKDDTIFERRAVLIKLRKNYHSEWFKKIWRDLGVKLIYFNTEPPIEEVRSRIKKLCRNLSTFPISRAR